MGPNSVDDEEDDRKDLSEINEELEEIQDTLQQILGDEDEDEAGKD